MPLAHRLEFKPRVHQRGDRGTDARAMILERGADGVQVGRTYRRAKPKICSQKRCALTEFLRILVQQTQPHPFAHLQLLRNLIARAALNADAHHTEHCALHQQQQGQGQRHDARGQAPAPAVLAQCPAT